MKDFIRETDNVTYGTFSHLAGMGVYQIRCKSENKAYIGSSTNCQGTYDILNPDTHLLQEKAKKEGIDIQIKDFKMLLISMDLKILFVVLLYMLIIKIIYQILKLIIKRNLVLIIYIMIKLLVII